VPLQDDDRYDIPEPAERHRDDYYDVLDYTLFKPIGQWFDIPRQMRKIPGRPYRARNVTAFEEVQDSSWWTNRIGKRPMSAAQLSQGANRRLGPDTDSTWRIVRAKTMGVTPGFTIVDGRGDAYVIKFDPQDQPELATGAEVICSRLFWAIGYNVPENYIVVFDPDILQIDPQATVPEFGNKVPMQPRHLSVILDKVPHMPDGRVRALASRYLDGRPIGPFSFHGTRSDDPNDIIRHEHRRELRAYRVFAAWLHHNDCRAINTLDTYVERDGRGWVQHNLIDFGATLGSRSYGQNLRSEGHEYLWDFGITAASLVSLGLYERPWLSQQYETYRGTGRFSAAYFSPADWKPDYPNPAFDNMTRADAFWAAKIIMRFDDALLRAAVNEARFSDPRATELLVRVLRERRRRIGKEWIRSAPAMDNFRLRHEGGLHLEWDDLAVHYGFLQPRVTSAVVETPAGQRWSQHVDDTSLRLEDIASALADEDAGDASTRLLEVELQGSLGDFQWTPVCHVTVYVPVDGTPRIVRVVRDD
jgi:hypothetical protein